MKTSERAFMQELAKGVFRLDADGSIWRLKRYTRSGRLLPAEAARAERCVSGGYLQVVFSTGGKRFHCQAHRLVWLALHGEIPEGTELNHKNGLKRDNRPENLELVTPSGNMQHAYRTGLKAPPVRPINGLAKLSPEAAETIRARLRTEAVTQQILADEYGVTQTTISKLARGKAWPADDRLHMTE